MITGPLQLVVNLYRQSTSFPGRFSRRVGERSWERGWHLIVGENSHRGGQKVAAAAR